MEIENGTVTIKVDLYDSLKKLEYTLKERKTVICYKDKNIRYFFENENFNLEKEYKELVEQNEALQKENDLLKSQLFIKKMLDKKWWQF